MLKETISIQTLAYDNSWSLDQDLPMFMFTTKARTFSTHPGTPSALQVMVGTKTFQRISLPGSGGTGNASTGPSCTDLRTGTQNATHAEISYCQAEVQVFPVIIGAAGLVQSINGQTCTFLTRGTQCFDIYPDQYQCGACVFDVQAMSNDGSTPVGWAVNVDECSDACAQYCCTMDSDIRFASDYWLDQIAPGGSGTGGTGASTGGTSSRDPCAGCGYPFCDGNCAGCC